jgi:dihydroxy-acid dehydratase
MHCVDDPNLEIDENCVMVLKYVGPVGYPGMPEVGNMLLPKKILEKGVTDMVRISDGRMSGTAFRYRWFCMYLLKPLLVVHWRW